MMVAYWNTPQVCCHRDGSGEMGHVIHLYVYTVEGGLMPWMLKDGSSLQLLEPCVHMRLATFNGQVY